MPRLEVLLARLVGPTIRRQQLNRSTQLDELPPPAGAVLFIGDSITEGAEWAEWFPQLTTVNRGIGGDTVAGVRGRVSASVNSPRLISLLIGTNDLSGFGSSTKVVDIASQTHALVRELKAAAPGAQIVMTAVMPRSRRFATDIQQLNSLNARMAAKEGLSYIDLWDALAGQDGQIAERFSADRLHLTGAGYAVWVDALKPHLH